MTRRTLLEELAKAGISFTGYQLDYLVSNGMIPRPGLNERGFRVYKEKHLAAVERVVSKRRSRQERAA